MLASRFSLLRIRSVIPPSLPVDSHRLSLYGAHRYSRTGRTIKCYFLAIDWINRACFPNTIHPVITPIRLQFTVCDCDPYICPAWFDRNLQKLDTPML